MPASKELGYDITLPQRRAVIVKAGTDPAKIKVLADALAKVAASAEYKQYLKEQYARPTTAISRRSRRRRSWTRTSTR